MRATQVVFKCDYCGCDATKKPSHIARRKRNFCSRLCYSSFRRDLLPKEEHPRYGSGADESTRKMKRKARSELNHAIRNGSVMRDPCIICGHAETEGHHEDYSQPLKVKWLCFRHHRMVHYNPELLTGGNQ